MENDNKNTFEYTYSAPQQEEIRRIREKYIPKEKTISKMDQLRLLDRKSELPGKAVSITLGIVGTLMLGFSMSCVTVMQQYFVPGVVIGVIGIFVLAMAYPAYRAITKRERRKIAPEILRLSEELERGV